MLDIAAKAIDQYYKRKDCDTFRKKCKNELDLFKEIKDYIDNCGLKVSGGSGINSPARMWFIHFNNYKKGNFEIAYRTTLEVSKVAPLFNISHDFTIENKSRDIIAPDLDEYSDHPYCKDQAALHEKIVTVMKQKGYIELSYAQIDEAVEGFKMPPHIKIFGKNITVSHLLFFDPFHIREK